MLCSLDLELYNTIFSFFSSVYFFIFFFHIPLRSRGQEVLVDLCWFFLFFFDVWVLEKKRGGFKAFILLLFFITRSFRRIFVFYFYFTSTQRTLLYFTSSTLLEYRSPSRPNVLPSISYFLIPAYHTCVFAYLPTCLLSCLLAYLSSVVLRASPIRPSAVTRAIYHLCTARGGEGRLEAGSWELGGVIFAAMLLGKGPMYLTRSRLCEEDGGEGLFCEAGKK